MKAILEFELPDDQRQLDLMLLAEEMASTIQHVDQLIRNHLKHGDCAMDQEILARCRGVMADIAARTME